ncbi:MAG: hypothetical protein HQL16_02395 [Candidatus Omnitrophica bacterium]|nr:hypothetical protein [Candidatus Omnitrophota bacterium]
MTFKRLMFLIKSDVVRFAEVHRERLTMRKAISIFLLPCLQAIFLYRLSHYCLVNKIIFFPRFFYTLNIMIYSTEIFPTTEIGPYFYMPHPVAVVIYGKMGERCTVYAQAGLGGRNMDGDDYASGWQPGFPCVGDNVTISARSFIIGAVTVGSGSFIGVGSIVTKDIPENSLALGVPARVRSLKKPSEDASGESNKDA